MRSNDTEIAPVELPRHIGVGGESGVDKGPDKEE